MTVVASGADEGVPLDTEKVTTKVYVADNAPIAFALGANEALLSESRLRGKVLLLHLWRAKSHGIVLGSACKTKEEVHQKTRRSESVGIFRRFSGGGTVLLGPNVWCYSFFFSKACSPGSIHEVFSWVHTIVCRVLAKFGVQAESVPLSDLAVSVNKTGPLKKLAGHAQKRTRFGVLCEGSLLAAPFPFSLGGILKPPLRQPPYRQGRSHDAFLTDLRALTETEKSTASPPGFPKFVQKLCQELQVEAPTPLPQEIHKQAARFAEEKYTDPGWTERL